MSRSRNVEEEAPKLLPSDIAPVTLPGPGGLERVHDFDTHSTAAINAALGAGRPLLVRGEPGVGKTQLAEAAAEVLERAFIRHVVDSRTESRDLLFFFDAVMRLAEAQLCSVVDRNANQQTADRKAESPRDRLEIKRFVQPGPLWWAFDSEHAAKHCADNDVQTDKSPLDEGKNRDRSKNGWVVLIDEIDKAESDVPNGLLEALGSGEFQPMGCHGRVKMSDPLPLIVITTNEERILPDAFVRRCVVLHVVLPDVAKQKVPFMALMQQRGKAHFPNLDEAVLKKAAEILVEDRAFAIEKKLQPKPGQAEYLDLLRAVEKNAASNEDSAAAVKEKQLRLLDEVANYIMRKPFEMQDTKIQTKETAE